MGGRGIVSDIESSGVAWHAVSYLAKEIQANKDLQSMLSISPMERRFSLCQGCPFITQLFFSLSLPFLSLSSVLVCVAYLVPLLSLLLQIDITDALTHQPHP